MLIYVWSCTFGINFFGIRHIFTEFFNFFLFLFQKPIDMFFNLFLRIIKKLDDFFAESSWILWFFVLCVFWCRKKYYNHLVFNNLSIKSQSIFVSRLFKIVSISFHFLINIFLFFRFSTIVFAKYYKRTSCFVKDICII